MPTALRNDVGKADRFSTSLFAAVKRLLSQEGSPMRELRSMWLRACRGMLALGFLVGITRPALAAVVTFESLNAPGNGTGGLLLKNQLAGGSSSRE
jgi:hypothetical protein